MWERSSSPTIENRRELSRKEGRNLGSHSEMAEQKHRNVDESS